MTGILLLFLLGMWVGILVLLVNLMLQFIKPRLLAVGCSLVFSVLFMCAPVYDEIVGGYQFRRLCGAEAMLIVDESKAKNKTVVPLPLVFSDVSGYELPIKKQYWAYVDIDTKEVVVSWNVFSVEGGWLMQRLKISETNSPLIFDGNCNPGFFGSKVFKKLNINVKWR